jgi:hypothetical protein
MVYINLLCSVMEPNYLQLGPVHLWLVKNLYVLKCFICSFLQLLGVLSFEFGCETFLCYYWCFSRAYLFILSKPSLLLEYFPILITIRYTKVSGLKTGNIWQLTNRSVVIKNFYYTSIQTCMTQILRTSVIGEKKNA